MRTTDDAEAQLYADLQKTMFFSLTLASLGTELEMGPGYRIAAYSQLIVGPCG
jgi:hypothetical protein